MIKECFALYRTQCDQIWRIFATLPKVYKSLAHFDGLFFTWQIAEPTLANLRHFWAKFHCCKWPNNLTI